MTYQDLLIAAENDGINILETKFPNNNVKGFFCNDFIAINIGLDKEVEKKCVLAEELGHCKYNIGDILDQRDISNLKQEKLARRWSYRKLVPLRKIIDAFEEGILNRFEFAEFADVTEEFLQEALDYYRDKYGLMVTQGDYTIYFEPLGVLKKI